MEDPDREEFSKLLDEWCERVESAARRLCGDLESRRIEFYREKTTVKVVGPEVAAIDCLMQAMVQRHDSMDTSLTGVYEVVLDRLEKQRDKLHRLKK